MFYIIMKISSTKIQNINNSYFDKQKQKIEPEIAAKKEYTNNYAASQALRASVTFRGSDFSDLKNTYLFYQEKKIRESQMSQIKKSVCFQAINYEKNNKELNFSIDDLIELMEKNENVTDKQAENILNRDLINDKIKFIEEIDYFSSLTDEQWNEIKYKGIEILNNALTYKSKSLIDSFESYHMGKISIDELYENYSNIYVKNLVMNILKYNTDKTKDTENILNEKLEKGNAETSDLEVLVNLAFNNRVLPKQIFDNLQKNSRISPNISKDIDLLNKAFTEGEIPVDIFVPEFKNEKEALEKVNVGDVLRLNGEKNIRIKKDDEDFQEIFVTPKTYMKLFPPVERFTYIQGKGGHCFLLAGIDVVYSNPNTRYLLMQMLKENEDGTISIAKDGFEKINNEIKPKNVEDFVFTESFKNLKLNENVNSITCNGLQFFENYFEKLSEFNADRYIKEKYEIFKSAEFDAEDNTYIDDLKYSKEDVNTFLNMVEDYFNNKTKTSKKLFSLANLYDKVILNPSVIKIDEETENDYINNILKRYAEYFERTGDKEKVANDIIPLIMLDRLLDEDITSYNMPYVDIGGSSNNIMEVIGLKTKTYPIKSKEAQELLTNKNRNKSMGFVVSSEEQRNTDGIKIDKSHAYFMAPIEINEETKYIVKNPHNTTFEIILDLEQLNKLFDSIEIGYINK